MKDQRPIPTAPLLLGLAGLLPFWALAIGLLLRRPALGSPSYLAWALASYGAIILSFLGGIRWGLAMTAKGTAVDYALSIVPSLIGWALVMIPDPWRFMGLGIVLIGLGPIDVGLAKNGTAPFWFGRLRLILSSGAGAALLVAAGQSR